jgi:hypothetical protein
MMMDLAERRLRDRLRLDEFESVELKVDDDCMLWKPCDC